MKHHKVLIEWLVTPDRKSIAEARSEAIASGDGDNNISQNVTVDISSVNHSSRSSSSSSSTNFTSSK